MQAQSLVACVDMTDPHVPSTATVDDGLAGRLLADEAHAALGSTTPIMQ